MQQRRAARGAAPSTSAPSPRPVVRSAPRFGRSQPRPSAAAVSTVPEAASLSPAEPAGVSKLPSTHLESSQKALELLKLQQTNR
jgi:hypothetical protein